MHQFHAMDLKIRIEKIYFSRNFIILNKSFITAK